MFRFPTGAYFVPDLYLALSKSRVEWGTVRSNPGNDLYSHLRTIRLIPSEEDRSETAGLPEPLRRVE
jgi:hypothetical protein